ncbi:MFS transporter [Nocardioides halotolerans]|uniref:MFS transporter n=1 Tax=Nocardioides halotolerans TaxID=433660 RepID=UPI0004242C1E|nr:MFS transporter [Nocardioides halotolerans]
MRRYLRATFDSLHSPNFRRYLSGQGMSVIGTWMQKVAQAWLVLELTDSGAVLGITAALQQLPTLLLTTWGGLLADRLDKRRVLLVTQSAAAVPAVALGVLTLTDHVTIWMVMVAALVLGVIESVDRPVRLTYVSEIVDPARLTNAVALNSITQNVGKVVGPAVAGVTIAWLGIGPTFLINAASFLAMIVGLARIRREQPAPEPLPRTRGATWQGFSYVRSRPALLGPLVLMTVSGTLAYNWTVVLPLLARQGFGEDARVVGLMFTCMGLGGVVSGLAFAGALRPTTSRLAVAGLVFSLLMCTTALAPSLTLAYVSLVALGGSSVLFRAVANSVLQLRAEPEMRGRVIALLVLATQGTTTVGGPIIGWFCEVTDPRFGFLLGGIGTAIAAAVVHSWMGERRLAARAASEPAGAAQRT